MLVSPRVSEVLARLEETRGLYFNLARSSAELLFVLARLARSTNVVEVGTANGYSAIILGAAVQPFGGRVTTIERDGRLVEGARKNILAAGLEDVVTVSPGGAYKILKRLSGPFDFVFLDGTKQEYLGYLREVRPKLAPGALLVADNLLSHRRELEEFTRAVVNDPLLSSTVLPVGMGLLIAVNEVREPASLDRRIPAAAGTRVSALGELVAESSQRVFQGTAAEVQRGEVFRHTGATNPHRDVPQQDCTMDGYDAALAEEAARLPGEG